MTNTKFKDYALNEDILRAIDLLGFDEPTEVQKKIIPMLLDNKDVVVKSQTGSGKTAAFAIPLCQLVDWEENKPQVLVLTPTRELALQVKEDMFNIGRYKRLKVEAIFGKASFEGQQRQLKQKTHIVVGTPGRIFDHIERGTLDVSAIKYLVIDEADEMFNMGFVEQMEAIIDELPHNRVTALLSATMPEDIRRLCEQYMKEPEHIEVEQESKVIERVQQEYYVVKNEDKLQLLQDVLTVENPDSCIIFCNTQQQVDEVYYDFFEEGYVGQRLHGGLEQRDRIKVITDFKHGYFRYLIATDVAARGLDIEKVALIVNYDIPRENESYVHRIGRTGRIDNEGKAITFLSQEEKKFLKRISDFIEKDLDLKVALSEAEVAAKREAFETKIHSRVEIKKEKGMDFKEEILKLHINAGKKTKMRASDVVGALCSIPGMSADDIGIISIVDVSTFVEILNNKGELVYEALQTLPMKGRVRKVSKANKTSYEIDYQQQQ